MSRRKIIIMGAAGRDFHNFNTTFRANDDIEVTAFTATQIPNIDGRRYPAELAGENYPYGIPIVAEDELPDLVTKHEVDEVVFSYSDVPYSYIMRKSALVNSLGATFSLLGPKFSMLKSKVPVVAVCAVRTGCGKSQTTRRVAEILKAQGKKIVAIRHPMPYGDLVKQAVQRFETLDDLKKHDCTIEEMEEYEPHIVNGSIVYAGVDYGAILEQAEKEADVILWDGGNNDMPFYKPDIFITVVDPLRPGHELSYYPGEANLRMADTIVINKVDSANAEDIQTVWENINAVNPKATVIDAVSPISVDDPTAIRGKRVLVVEDGPTLTHGEMKFGAGVVAAQRFGAAEIVDPRPFLKGSLVDTFEKYKDIGAILPAMGYGEQQMKDLQATIQNTECDAVIVGTPIDLRRIIQIEKPSTRVYYNLQEIGSPTLDDVLIKLK